MNTSPLVSVIITTYNSARFLPKCVESVLAQSYKNLEIIIIDDGSIDQTCDLVKKFGDAVQYHYQENKGVSAARNAGLKHANGEFIQFVDADDYIHPEKIEKQLKAFTENDISIVYSDYTLVDTSGNELTEATQRLKAGLFDDKAPMVDRLMKECFLLIHSQLTRRRVFDEEGGFDETEGISEDWDVWLRFAVRGLKFKYLPGVFAYYVKHENSLTQDHQVLHQHRLVLLKKFKADNRFRSLDEYNYARFCSYQYRALANDCWNFRNWKAAREYLKKSIAANPDGADFRDYLLVAKSFAHQIIG